MVAVDSPDGFLDPLVKFEQSSVLRISRLVQGVVPRDPSVILVVLIQSQYACPKRNRMTNRGKFLPDKNGSILEILVIPDYL
jgi:hypothetical protein